MAAGRRLDRQVSNYTFGLIHAIINKLKRLTIMSTNKTKFDYQDCIILGGCVHVLTDEVRKCDGVEVNNVCTICSLRGECNRAETNLLCCLLGAQDNEYFTMQAAVYHDTTTDRWYIEE